MRTTRSLARPAVGVLLAGLAVAGTTATASAASANDDVRRSGSCSGTSDWKLKASPDDGRLEVEAEVDSNRVGQTWTWRLTDNGVLVARGTSRTVAPSGSFEVERRTANRAGVDQLRFRATNAATGETCTGTLRI